MLIDSSAFITSLTVGSGTVLTDVVRLLGEISSCRPADSREICTVVSLDCRSEKSLLNLASNVRNVFSLVYCKTL